MTYIGYNIKAARKYYNMTQNDFAALLGISRSVLGSYEEGRARPSYESLIHICDILEVQDLRSFIAKKGYDPDNPVLSAIKKGVISPSVYMQLADIQNQAESLSKYIGVVKNKFK